MTISDLTQLSTDELDQLVKDVKKEHSRREAESQQEAIRQISELARAAGLSLAEVAKTERKTRAKLPAKYRNPADPSQKWSGRGKQPRWLADGLAAGQTLDYFKV